MGEEIARDRLEAARLVSTMLLEATFRDSLPAHPSGEQPILIASRDDPMGDVFRRIEAVGLPLTLCVCAQRNSLTVLTVKEASPGSHEDDVSIDPDATLGMFLSYVWLRGSVHAYLAESAKDLELALT